MVGSENHRKFIACVYYIYIIYIMKNICYNDEDENRIVYKLNKYLHKIEAELKYSLRKKNFVDPYQNNSTPVLSQWIQFDYVHRQESHTCFLKY